MDFSSNTISIDITHSLVWIFQNCVGDKDGDLVKVAKEELPAIHKAIGEYLKAIA